MSGLLISRCWSFARSVSCLRVREASFRFQNATETSKTYLAISVPRVRRKELW